MKTAEQTVRYLEDLNGDPFGFTANALLLFLTFEQAKPLLKPDADAVDWGDPTRPLTREGVIEEMRDYMKFAWSKVEDHRGISAERSVAHMEAWLWLLDDDAFIRSVQYAQYGAPKLKAICERYGFPVPDSPAIARMAQGLPCRDGCEEGCDA